MLCSDWGCSLYLQIPTLPRAGCGPEGVGCAVQAGLACWIWLAMLASWVDHARSDNAASSHHFFLLGCLMFGSWKYFIHSSAAMFAGLLVFGYQCASHLFTPTRGILQTDIAICSFLLEQVSWQVWCRHCGTLGTSSCSLGVIDLLFRCLPQQAV